MLGFQDEQNPHEYKTGVNSYILYGGLKVQRVGCTPEFLS